MIMASHEFERNWKEEIMTFFTVICQHSPADIGKAK
jgi:hypothetical protein